jgi:cytoskeleton-associated protein 5
MVKTVLHELVKLRGTAIKGHLSMVPIDAEPQPIILAYIDLNLQVELAKPPLPTSFFVQPFFFLAKQHCLVVVDPCSR